VATFSIDVVITEVVDLNVRPSALFRYPIGRQLIFVSVYQLSKALDFHFDFWKLLHIGRVSGKK